jgi:SAM-dependent methyltransferase
MTEQHLTQDAAEAYDRLAPYYDRFTANYAHDQWVTGIVRHARALGVRGNRALDVACGTGKSTAPLLSRGYTVRACDISAEMVGAAREKFPSFADAFLVADMRHLPELGEFDLVLCLDDALNYLLSDAELEATFSSVSRQLSDTGVFAFDLNSLLTYQRSFAHAMVRERDGVFFAWNGDAEPSFSPGAQARATIDVFAERPDGLWERRSSRHTQRHQSPETVHAALSRGGLECVAVMGQQPGGRLVDDADESRCIKLVYFVQCARQDIQSNAPAAR